MSFGTTFLAHPDLFPARAAGEAWGDAALALAIAGEPYRVDGLADGQWRALAARLGEAVVRDPAGPAPVATVDVLRAAVADFRVLDLRGFDYAPEVDAAGGVLRLAGLGLMARIVPGTPHRATVWTPEPEGDGFAGVVETVLRVLVALRLFARGGLLVHAAAVVRAGEAWVFAGRSGAGKTTTARHAVASGLTVLSDDLVAAVPGDRCVEVLRVPFTGDLRPPADAPERVPLGAWVRLEQAPTEGCRRLLPGECAALLAACAPGVDRAPAQSDALLATAAALGAAAPGLALRLTRARIPWSLLDDAVAAAP